MQHGFVAVPQAAFGAPSAPFVVRDLLSGAEYRWRGERHYVRLEPAMPGHIFAEVP
jgi:hypothetical protein